MIYKLCARDNLYEEGIEEWRLEIQYLGPHRSSRSKEVSHYLRNTLENLSSKQNKRLKVKLFHLCTKIRWIIAIQENSILQRTEILYKKSSHTSCIWN